jgi:AcrR family transcriptional regulator
VTATPTRRRTQTERRQLSERKLLLATAELIVERGLDNASVADIARRAGYSHALVTHLFGTKLDMIERLNELVDEFYAAEMVPSSGGSGLTLLTDFASLYLKLATGSDPLGRVHLVLWTEAIAGTSDIRPSRVAWDRHFRQGVTAMIRQGISDGSIPGHVDAATTALVVVGTLRGIALQLLLDPAAARSSSIRVAVPAAVRKLVS